MTSRSLSDIAQELIVSVRTVEAFVANGELRAINVSRDPKSKKPRLRVLQTDLDAFLRARATDSTSTSQPSRPRRKRVEILHEYV